MFQKSGKEWQIAETNYKQDGYLHALALAWCVRINDQFSFGLTLNFWKDWLNPNGWEQNANKKARGEIIIGEDILPIAYEYRIIDHYSFDGFNINIGCMWKPSKKFVMGLVLKTPFKAELKHDRTVYSKIDLPLSKPKRKITHRQVDEILKMPMSYGFGMAYHMSKRLAVSFDLSRTEWHRFIRKESKGKQVSAVSGLDLNKSDIDPTHHVRIGIEYLCINKKARYVIPLRFGAFFDPGPSENKPDKYYGITLGSGLSIKDYIFDIAYQCRFGNDVGDSILQHYKFSQNIEEHHLYCSFVYHF